MVDTSLKDFNVPQSNKTNCEQRLTASPNRVLSWTDSNKMMMCQHQCRFWQAANQLVVLCAPSLEQTMVTWPSPWH